MSITRKQIENKVRSQNMEKKFKKFEEKRIIAVGLFHDGVKTNEQIAKILGIHVKTVITWRNSLATIGIAAFIAPKPRKRGMKLEISAQESIVNTVLTSSPLDHGFSSTLWIREFVVQLIQTVHGITVSFSTATEILRRAGLSPQKPVRRSYKQDPNSVQNWITKAFPELNDKVKNADGVLLWLDESHIESEHNYGRSWGKEGETPIIPSSGERFSMNMIGSLSIGGELDIMTFQGSCNSSLVIAYLQSLINKHNGVKIFVIMDNAKYHTAAAIGEFVAKNSEYIEIIYQPKYSPELNPIELVWGNIKCHNISKSFLSDKNKFEEHLNEICTNLANNKPLLKNLFKKKEVAYILAA